MSSPLLFAHIEKTGGTSVKSQIEDLFDGTDVFIYDAASDTIVPSEKTAINHNSPVVDFARRVIRKSPIMMPVRRGYERFRDHSERNVRVPANKVPVSPNAVYGNFQADRFDGLIHNPRLVTVVRDPLRRTASQFMQWKQLSGTVELRGHIPFDPELSFTDFALSDEMRNFQTRTLGNKEIRDFELIGVTGRLREFLGEVGLLGANTDAPHQNRTPERMSDRDLGIDGGFIRDFEEQNQADYELVRAVEALWG